MEVGFAGLGRMGKNMALRLMKDGHRILAYNRSPGPREEAAKHGVITFASLEELAKNMKPPRVIWVMVTHTATDDMINGLLPHLDKGDIIIDGGNSFFKDSQRRYLELSIKGIKFLDMGTSGGVVAAERGYCIMVGGDREVFDYVEPLLKSLAMPGGYMYIGESGSGHFVKMVHNAVEYGMMQSIGEGFNLMQNGPYQKLNLAAIANLWNHGSIVSSFLVEMTQKALEEDAGLEKIEGHVEDSGEGRWAIQTALEHSVPVETIAQALFSRYNSRKRGEFAHKIMAAQRNKFGAHPVKEKKE
jgi:6-phosphogluconate dehydrogenase